MAVVFTRAGALVIGQLVIAQGLKTPAAGGGIQAGGSGDVSGGAFPSAGGGFSAGGTGDVETSGTEHPLSGGGAQAGGTGDVVRM